MCIRDSLVVEYDGGKQKQCNFKDERDVDALLELLAKQQPQICLLYTSVQKVRCWTTPCAMAGC